MLAAAALRVPSEFSAESTTGRDSGGPMVSTPDREHRSVSVTLLGLRNETSRPGEMFDVGVEFIGAHLARVDGSGRD